MISEFFFQKVLVHSVAIGQQCCFCFQPCIYFKMNHRANKCTSQTTSVYFCLFLSSPLISLLLVPSFSLLQSFLFVLSIVNSWLFLLPFCFINDSVGIKLILLLPPVNSPLFSFSSYTVFFFTPLTQIKEIIHYCTCSSLIIFCPLITFLFSCIQLK